MLHDRCLALLMGLKSIHGYSKDNLRAGFSSGLGGGCSQKAPRESNVALGW